MSFNRGDVVLVPFPFTDLTTQKQRPALVVSSKDFNDSSSDAILLAITSQIPTESQPTTSPRLKLIVDLILGIVPEAEG